MYSLFKCSLAWSSSSKGKSFPLQTYPTGLPLAWRPVLPVKTEMERIFRASAFFHVLCHQVACPIQQWKHIFSGLPFVAEKPFWLPFTSLARLNSRWSLTLLTYPCMFRLCPCSSWAICPCSHLLCAFLLSFEFCQELLAHPWRSLLCRSCLYSRAHYSTPMCRTAGKYHALDVWSFLILSLFPSRILFLSRL